jgi:hypothetical protein
MIRRFERRASALDSTASQRRLAPPAARRAAARDGNQGSFLPQIRPSHGPGGITRTAQAPARAAIVNEFRTAPRQAAALKLEIWPGIHMNRYIMNLKPGTADSADPKSWAHDDALGSLRSCSAIEKGVRAGPLQGRQKSLYTFNQSLCFHSNLKVLSVQVLPTDAGWD